MADPKRERWASDRDERRSTKGPDKSKGGGREKNVGHKDAEEHHRGHQGRDPGRKK